MNGVRQFFATARRRWRSTDRLVRAIVANWIGGMLVGLVCAALLLAFDFFGVRSLLWRSDIAIAGTMLLCAAFAFTFGGLVCAGAVMNFGGGDDAPRGGGRARSAPAPRPSFAALPARRAR